MNVSSFLSVKYYTSILISFHQSEDRVRIYPKYIIKIWHPRFRQTHQQKSYSTLQSYWPSTFTMFENCKRFLKYKWTKNNKHLTEKYITSTQWMNCSQLLKYIFNQTGLKRNFDAQKISCHFFAKYAYAQQTNNQS